MSKYGDFLKANGASDEDIKIWDTPVTAKAFEKQQADLDAERNRYAAKDKELKDYHGTVTSYYEESDAKLKAMQNKVVSSQAEAERFRGALVAARDEGLIQVAENLLTPPKADPVKPPADTQYINRDDFFKAVDGVGDGLAWVIDLTSEHAQLFPNQPLKMRELRQESLAAGEKSVPAYWERKYGVPAARAAKAQASHDAEVAKWKAEGAKEKETELISRGFNPDTRPLMPSTSPFTKRPDPTGIRAKQPWDHADGTLSNDRVRRVTEKLVKEQFHN